MNIEYVNFNFGCTERLKNRLPVPQKKPNMCEELYQCVGNNTHKNEKRFFAILQDKLIDNPSYAFLSGLVFEELRRFNQGYDSSEGLKSSWQHDAKQKEFFKDTAYSIRSGCSYTVTYFLLDHLLGKDTVGDSSFFKPIISTENYKKMVSILLGNLPLCVLNRELLDPQPFSLKYSYYSPVSLVFQMALKELKKTHSVFWQNQAIGLLERGASIDYGYIYGKPVFVACANEYAAYELSKKVLRCLKLPNRAGVCDYAPIHAVICKRLPMEILEHLLKSRADTNASCTEEIFSGTKRTALEIAVKVNHVNAAELLLKYGANPNTYSVKPDSSCFSEESVLTPYQTAVQKGNHEMLSLFFSHRDKTGIPLLTELEAREQARRENRHLHIIERGEATLEKRAQAIQIQTTANQLKRLFEITGLQAYAASASTKYELSNALMWIFNEVQYTAAASIWKPVLHAFKNEISQNKHFKITAFHDNMGACYNDDTQSDIYVHPDFEACEYKHILPHEIAHLYSFKYHTSNAYSFLKSFGDTIEKDGLLTKDSEKFRNLPSSLVYLLENMWKNYEKSQFEHELFPRVCVQFPILYVLSNPGCKESDLLQLMHDIMPETFSLYKRLVMNEATD